jgi:hypothetical protein
VSAGLIDQKTSIGITSYYVHAGRDDGTAFAGNGTDVPEARQETEWPLQR